MLGSLDAHTQYLDRKQYNDLMVGTRGSFGGLGIVISIRDKILTVIAPIDGTPASRMGIQGGDQIVVIERGRIVERGRHAELLARRGVYSQLHELQFSREG